MSALIEPLIGNHLLALLTTSERRQLLQRCEVVELAFGEILCQPGQTYRYVYFPLSSFISLVSELANHKPLELGLVGNEGMLGASLSLGVNAAPMQAIVQGKGTAWRISLADFQQLLGRCPQLRHIMQQYLYVLMVQLSQSAVCVHFHELEQRLARWLLMSHDRAHSNTFYLTHQLLADMLGVRRSGVTVAAGVMQQKQLISYTRGAISMLNRAALQQISCECYQVAKNDYHRLLGEPASDSNQQLATEQGTP